MKDTSVKKAHQVTLRYFLVIFLLMGAILAGTISVLYNWETRDYLSRLEDEERINVRLQRAIINSSFHTIVSDIKFLSRQNELRDLLGSGDSRYKNAIAREYLELARQRQVYDQIRFLDNSGMEVVRINFNDGALAIVSDNHLQSKASRYYYKDAIALAPDVVFVSPFDLNVEKGEIEQPLKPMIRFGIPVFDGENRKRGIVVLNYLGQALIDALKAAAENSPGDFMLVNSDGFWLSCPLPEDEWGFMIEARRNRRFSTDFPGEWRRIVSGRTEQIHSEHGLFTAATIYPFAEGLKSSSGSAEVSGDSSGTIDAESYYWKLISHVPQKRMKTGTRGLLIKLFFLAVTLFVLASLPSWLIAQAVVRRKLHQMALYRSANFDKLTELPNRQLFLDRLNEILKQSIRYERIFALLFIDLDGFKSVNDTRGHDAGDELLIQVARRLMGAVRDSDTVARMGGDEFTVILSTVRSPDDAGFVAGKIVEELSTAFTIKNRETRIGASVGISLYPDDGRDPEMLLKKADDAMYQAKKQGKNGYRFSGS